MTVQKFTSNGQMIPFSPGFELEGYTIEARRQWMDSYWYLVKGAHGAAVLHESPAYFKPQWQKKIWQAITPVMAKQDLISPEESLIGFQKTWQEISLNYTVYPRSLWPALERPLQDEFWETGLLEEESIRMVYEWIREQQQQLSALGWCNPSLALPNIVLAEDRSLQLIEWDYAVPIHGELNYPRFFQGYHNALTYLKQDAKETVTPLEIAWSAAFSTMVALIQGKSPRFWAPQACNYQSVLPYLSSEMRLWLEQWKTNIHPENWPDLPRHIYKKNSQLNDYQDSCIAFNKAFAAYHDQQWENAREWARESCEKHLNDPWSWFLLARAEWKIGQKQRAQQALNEALRHQSLACIWREQAQISLQEGDLENAKHALQEALKVCPQDDASWYLQGLIAYRQENLLRAEKAFKMACKLRPLNNKYRQYLMDVLRNLGSEAEALNLPRFNSAEQAHLNYAFTAPQYINNLLESKVGSWKIVQELRSSEFHSSHLYQVKHLYNHTQGILKSFSLNHHAQAFEQESRLARQIKHPNLMRLKEERIEQKQGYLIYGWEHAPNLSEYLSQGALDSETWHKIAKQSDHALRYLEQLNVIHADLSPANILWHKKSKKLTIVDYDNLQQPGQRLKHLNINPNYAAPEIWQTYRADLSTDRYSMALILLHAATGLFPDLCRNWKKRNFDTFQKYALHLSGQVVEQLLEASQWDPGKRSKAPFRLSENLRPLSTQQQELSYAVINIAQCKDLELLKHQAQALMDLERSSMTYYHLAFHQLRLANYHDALISAQACLRINDWHVGARWVLADALMALQQNESARKILLQAQSIAPQEAETYRRLLDLYSQSGQFEMALASWQHLDHCLPFNLDVLLEKVALLLRFGCTSQAIQIIQGLDQQNMPPAVKERIRAYKQQARNGVFSSQGPGQAARQHKQQA